MSKRLLAKFRVPSEACAGFCLCAIALFSIASGCKASREIYEVGELPVNLLSLGQDEKSIAFVGDIMTWDRTREYLERYGTAYPFVATAAILKGADLAVGNLEGPVAMNSLPRKGLYVYKVPPWTLGGLKSAGFDIVDLANNHVADCGTGGVVETIENLDNAGIRYFGAGRSNLDAYAPAVVDVGGLKVAFVGGVTCETFFLEKEESLKKGAYKKRDKLVKRRLAARKDHPGAAVATKNNLKRMIAKAQESADIVVVQLHFGIRYMRRPTDFQRNLAHIAVEAGADLVVGHHAHIWQPAEVYKNTPIIYGLGNFAFGSLNRRADEALLTRSVIKGKKIARVELFPLYIKNKDKKVAFQPKVMKGRSADKMLENLKKRSKPLSAEIIIKNGIGVLEMKH